MKGNHGEQLKLFMTGQEWKGYVTHSTDGPISSLWEEKEARSKGKSGHGANVYESMRAHGYRQDDAPRPTVVFEKSPSGKKTRIVQSEGHHRVAAAAALERDEGKTVYIPTNYVDNTRR